LSKHNGTGRRLARAAAAAILAALMLFSSACGDKAPVQTETSAAEPITEPTAEQTTAAPETTQTTEEETTVPVDPLTDFDSLPEGDENAAEDAKNDVTVTETEKQDAAPAALVNPLTGLVSDTDLSGKRPVAIMFNNLRASLPQVGIGAMDVLYECLVEGGTTRLMGVSMNYESIPVIGSVRSSREYYIDFAANHDAIYVHAGGSTEAYNQLQSRGTNNLDGVNMYLPSTFYRDAERRKTMSLEHTLMTSGEGIVSGIEYKNYRTTISKSFTNPLNFVSPTKIIRITSDTAATHVIIPYNSAQFPQYIYNSKTRLYKRYQFNGVEHIDGADGSQLAFTNVLVVVCRHYDTNDEKGHVNVDTTGSGEGFYITGGKYIKIKWSKATADTPISFTYENGTPVTLNCGKTMINIVSPSVAENIVFNYNK